MPAGCWSLGAPPQWLWDGGGGELQWMDLASWFNDLTHECANPIFFFHSAKFSWTCSGRSDPAPYVAVSLGPAPSSSPSSSSFIFRLVLLMCCGCVVVGGGQPLVVCFISPQTKWEKKKKQWALVCVSPSGFVWTLPPPAFTTAHQAPSQRFHFAAPHRSLNLSLSSKIRHYVLLIRHQPPHLLQSCCN